MAKKQPNILRRHVMRDIREGVSEEDRTELTKELLQKLTEEDAMRSKAKDVASAFRNDLKDLHESIVELRAKIELGNVVNMEVEEIKDFKKNTVKFMRTDTREVVESRAMTEEDKQLEIDQEAIPEAEEKEGTEAGAEA